MSKKDVEKKKAWVKGNTPRKKPMKKVAPKKSKMVKANTLNERFKDARRGKIRY